MFRWIQKLSNKTKSILFIVFSLLFILALSLLISAIAHDGINEFAKIFIFYEKQPVEDERWKEFLRYAQEQKLGAEHIEKLRDIFGDTFYITVEKQNTIGFASFNLAMILLMFICFMFLSSLTYTTLREVMVRLTSLYHENVIDQATYDPIMELLKKSERNQAKQINLTIDPALLNAKLEEIETEKGE
ncbi:hypothetical protein [Mesomycoplasma molare]|uniref:ABC transporter permease n=1 Tax=Mesomycoplasma molare TaxID=171288 RepID=A0ABY5TWT8_9BACT|nr:hypothetical protein [Mesomycoplasma molare]UWD34046.1 hypothetical protein NX772_02985 [Mesomycoplasma molare]